MTFVGYFKQSTRVEIYFSCSDMRFCNSFFFGVLFSPLVGIAYKDPKSGVGLPMPPSAFFIESKK